MSSVAEGRESGRVAPLDAGKAGKLVVHAHDCGRGPVIGAIVAMPSGGASTPSTEPIEGTLSQAVRRFGLRRCRYLGQAKTHLQHVLTAAAMNLVRVDAWLRSQPRARMRQSRLATLLTAA
ncbi:transposase [Paracoccus sp. MC1862]|nr:transposase [Paracoccus sp. MC1862]QQO46598.1 transposase [Paracoccus sp. MC1862]